MQDEVFVSEQVVPRPRDEVFAFFSEPRNLEAITPPWLCFRILGRSTPEIEEGTQLTYRLRIHGLPMTWRSRIQEWSPRLPLGRLGRWIGGRYVASDVKKIFAYRSARTAELLRPGGSSAGPDPVRGRGFGGAGRR
jgi:hypothetical protein